MSVSVLHQQLYPIVACLRLNRIRNWILFIPSYWFMSGKIILNKWVTYTCALCLCNGVTEIIVVVCVTDVAATCSMYFVVDRNINKKYCCKYRLCHDIAHRLWIVYSALTINTCVSNDLDTFDVVCIFLNSQPDIRQDYPLNLSILLSGGKETNKDFPSNGEWSGNSSSLNLWTVVVERIVVYWGYVMANWLDKVPWKRVA